MRGFKKGFTLTEMLIVVVVIGVIAAIAIPQLIKGVEKKQAGATLGRAVEQIELGCQNMIQTANDTYEDGSYAQYITGLKTIDLTGKSSDNHSILHDIATVAAPYWGLKNMTNVDSNSYSFKKYDGTTESSGNPIDWLLGKINWALAKKYDFAKFPACAYIPALEQIEGFLNAESADLKIATIYIDTNNQKKPNAYGKDVFIFALNNSCKMIPYGSQDDDDNYAKTCTDTKITDGKSCAARVVADGFKITY